MPIRTLKVTTTGDAGLATGTKTSDFELRPSILDAVKVDYHASAPATTDLTISEAGGLGRTLLTLSNINTDGTYYPRHTTHDNVGADAGSKAPYIIEGKITVALAGCDALVDAVTVSLQIVENTDVR